MPLHYVWAIDAAYRWPGDCARWVNGKANSPPRPRIRSLTGAGITQFPESMVNSHINAGNLVVMMAAHMPVPVELNIVWPRTRHLIPKVRVIVDELLKKAGEGYFGELR